MTESPQPDPIRTLIVDDERLARSNLAVLLRRDPEIKIIGECGTGAEAVTTIRSERPEILFLDVQMPECDGFDVLELIGTKAPAATVFVTAHDEHALRAFDAGALDYLLKPFDNARFNLALFRAKERARQAKQHPQRAQRIAIKSAGQIDFVNICEIDWIEAANYYACLHVAGRSYLLRRTMAELEQELDTSYFCRIHRSTIVNLQTVQSMSVTLDGNHEVLLKGGVLLRLSEGYRKILQARLNLRK